MILLFATRDGARTLPIMLEALEKTTPPPDELHIVAVDNASADGTPAILRAWTDRLPLTVLREERPGKNLCLNVGLDHLGADRLRDTLVVLTDDDILPEPSWLTTYAAVAEAHPECDVFAGAITPLWPRQTPDWLESLSPHHDVLFAITRFEGGAIPCHAAFGPNMAVRGSVFASGVRFNERFGPVKGAQYAMGSETELMERLDREGRRAWSIAEPAVGHMIEPSLLAPESVIKRAFRHGLGCGLRGQATRGTPLWRLLASSWAKQVSANLRRLGDSADRSLLHRFRGAWAKGYAEGARLAHEERHRAAGAA
jgi:glycosyltransferase involved in cell wall biosynthesis